MWRSLFLAVGLFLVVMGIGFLSVDAVELKAHETLPASFLSMSSGPREGPPKLIVPAPWWPWSFLSAGAVTCLYSFTIPRRVQGK